jgi:ATP-dependent RNA helicase RhlE
MTPVQARAIPAVLRGEDVLASAETGSGKTAAFVLPILEALSAGPAARPRKTHALILAPTRELAVQIGESIATYGRHLPDPPKTVVVTGGSSTNPQMMALRGGADIVVATPGRLLDLARHNAVRLSSVATLVIDEADRMLALGFSEELAQVLSLLPPRRQSLLFSATLPRAVHSLADGLLRDPCRITTDAEPDAGEIAIVQRAIEVDRGKRTALLRHLLQGPGVDRMLVFVATKHGADHLARKLSGAGISAAAFHGEMSQGARSQALADFGARNLRVLVATDLAGRGLHIAELPCVVNYDLPRSAADYVHRIGRTGRAGAPGVAISFVSADTEAHFRLIERHNHVRVPRERIAGFEPVEAVPTGTATKSGPGAGGIKGKRKSKKDKLREAAARGR